MRSALAGAEKIRTTVSKREACRSKNPTSESDRFDRAARLIVRSTAKKATVDSFPRFPGVLRNGSRHFCRWRPAGDGERTG